MKRLLYNLLPKYLKEKSKVIYYNFVNKHYLFRLKGKMYITKSIKERWQTITNTPLYFIVDDIDRYEKFYKIKSGDIILDAGANEGVLSVVYSKKTTNNGKVYAFEPDSKNVNKLKQNIALNRDCNNIEIIEKALWNKKETIEFFESGNVASSVFYEGKNAVKVEVQTTTIDNFITSLKINQLHFVKMDIEGAEIEAMQGAIETIKKYQPEFSIASYHIVNNKPTYLALEKFFETIKYPYKTIFFSDGEIITYAGNSAK